METATMLETGHNMVTPYSTKPWQVNARALIILVGSTGIEPVTPAV
jgi:hypothetical protein